MRTCNRSLKKTTQSFASHSRIVLLLIAYCSDAPQEELNVSDRGGRLGKDRPVDFNDRQNCVREKNNLCRAVDAVVLVSGVEQKEHQCADNDLHQLVGDVFEFQHLFRERARIAAAAHIVEVDDGARDKHDFQQDRHGQHDVVHGVYF